MDNREVVPSSAITVMLVDDHAVVREGYRRLLERDPHIKVVGEAANAREAYQAYGELGPDVVVMDITLPDLSGIVATQRILARSATARILMFSIYEDAIFIGKALEAGAMGYITKSSAPEVLVSAVRAIAAGQRYLSQDAVRALGSAASSRRDGAMACLSPREFELLGLVACGLPLQTIAERLNLSPKTVANVRSTIKQKLGAQNSAQLVRIALRHGLGDAGKDS